MSNQFEIYDDLGPVQLEGPPGPTHFVRLGTERITPRAAGDLLANPFVQHIEWSTGWLYPTLINGWSNYGSGYSPARYRKVGSVVYLDGLIKGGTVGVPCCILAEGFRPTQRFISAGVDTGSLATERRDILDNGEVNAYTGSNGWQTLQCVFFQAN